MSTPLSKRIYYFYLLNKPKIWAVVFFTLLLLLFLSIPPVWNLVEGPVEVTQWRKGIGERIETIGPGERDWIESTSVSRHVLHAFVVSEDARFYQHKGLDFEEIGKSIELNYKHKRYVRGASTITQQVVKVAFLSRKKSLVRKFREAVGALILEKLIKKEDILEWYMNLAEFGDGIYGIKAASWHYFRTKPELLTVAQATHLALVLPSPNRWSVGLRRKSLTRFGHQRFALITNRLYKSRYITWKQWRHSLATGNFGHPVASYSEVVAKEAKVSKVEPPDSEQTGIPFLDLEEPEEGAEEQAID